MTCTGSSTSRATAVPRSRPDGSRGDAASRGVPARRRRPGVLAAFLLALASLVGAVLATPDLDRMESLAGTRYGTRAAETVAAWRRMMADAATVDEREQLTRVNDFFNRRVAYQEDQVLWNEKDYWATPLEMFGKGAGDCEDYSIGKYATLRLLGIPPERLRLIYVRARLGGAGSTLSQAHMVLGYFPTPTSEPLVLDNMVSEVRPAARRPDLTPVFSFNSEGLWAAGSTTSSADPTTRLSRWRNVLDRMREDGLQ